MKKHYVIILLLLSLTFMPAQSQSEKETGKAITKNLFVDIGGSYSNFQDTKYSDVREKGVGAHLRLGYNNMKEKKHFWEAGFMFNFTKDNASTHDQATSTVLYPNVYFKYLTGINKKLYVGARVDIYDNYIRLYQNLQNNATFATVGNYFYGSVLYQTDLSNKWRFKAIGDLALIGVQNESTGFAMSYSQKRIENGGVDYQDPKMGDPSSYAYAEFKHPGNNLIIKTEYSFMYKNRISFAYNWEMRRFATISGYPTTWGMHNVVFRFNIIHREKNK